METLWERVEEFPNYLVSSLGDIVNETTGRILHLSTTMQGAVKVNLIKDGLHYTRSVKVLVAEAFVGGRTDIFDTPIHLDGNQENNHVENLVWRPRWFAWKYARQFVDISDIHSRGPIIDVDTKQRYLDVYETAILNGLLLKDVWRSIHMRQPVFPTQQKFDIIRK